MNINAALKRARRILGTGNIDYAVNVGNGWVFSCELIDQMLYIDNGTIRGLNASIEKDAKIIQMVEIKIKNKEYY